MNTVDIIEGVFPKCKNLDIKNTKELGNILYVLGFLKPTEKFFARVWDPFVDNLELTLVDYLNGLWGMSKSEIQRLIKGGGLKVNNIIPSMDMKVRNLPWIPIDKDWRVCIIKKGKNQFDFILHAVSNTIFEMSDKELDTELDGLHYDITCESGGFAHQMKSYLDKLEWERKIRKSMFHTETKGSSYIERVSEF